MKNLLVPLAGALLFAGCAAGQSPATAPHSPSGSDHVHHADVLVRKGTGNDVANPFHPISLLLSHAENTGEVTIFEFVLPPRSPGSPPHTHSGEDEYFYVTEGQLSVLSGDEIVVLESGDFAALNRGNTHMFWNASNQTTRLIMITTGASFEAFISGVGPALAEAQPASPEAAGAVIGQMAAKYGITISMDRMPPEAAPYYAPPPSE